MPSRCRRSQLQVCRANQARNVERIVKAARDVYTAQGPAGHLEEIAERAGVNVSTLFRRFPDRQALVRAALLLGLRGVPEPTAGGRPPRRAIP